MAETYVYNINKFFLQDVLFLLHSGSCQNCMRSANLVAEIHQKLCNKRALSTGEHVLVNMLLCSSHFTEVH